MSRTVCVLPLRRPRAAAPACQARAGAPSFRAPLPRAILETNGGARGQAAPPARRGDLRDGVVLFATLLLVTVAALALAAGSTIAARAVVVASSRADAVRARLAAESAVRAALVSWRAGEERALPLLGERALPPVLRLAGGAEARVTVRRVGGDLYLVRGDGRAGAARASAAALVRVLSVGSFLALFPAALAADRVTLTASAALDVSPPEAPPPPWDAASCDPAAADTLAALFGAVGRPGIAAGALTQGGAAVSGDPPVAPAAPADSTGFGLLAWDGVAAAADRVENGALQLAPAERDGACDPAAPGNWGAPLDARSPCGSYYPLVYAPGDLRVLGGAGQGILVVRGHLELAGDTRFYGAIFAGGGVEAEPAVAVWGGVRAGSATWSGKATYAPCALIRALARAPGLGRPWRAGARLWLPPF